jgi:hypothetical protein
MPAANPCGVLQALANYQFEIIRSLNKKLNQLRRLAELLEQLGDLSLFLPNIGQLIPIINIDLSIYTDLQANCPFLNLPPATTEDLDKLRNKVSEAYALLARKLLNHPWLRMNKVQGMLNDFQNKLNFPYGDDYMRCLNATCAAIAQAGSLLSRVSQAQIGKELTDFGKNFVDNAGQVLTKSMQTKRDEAVQIYNQVLDLRSDSVQDFRSFAVGGSVNAQSPPLKVGHAVTPNFIFLPTGEVRFPSD